MDRQFSVSGRYQGVNILLRWINGNFELVSGDAAVFRDLLARLEQTALDLQDVNFTPLTIPLPGQLAHMACPLRLLNLLAYETDFPPILGDPEILSVDLFDEMEEGVKY